MPILLPNNFIFLWQSYDISLLHKRNYMKKILISIGFIAVVGMFFGISAPKASAWEPYFNVSVGASFGNYPSYGGYDDYGYSGYDDYGYSDYGYGYDDYGYGYDSGYGYGGYDDYGYGNTYNDYSYNNNYYNAPVYGADPYYATGAGLNQGVNSVYSGSCYYTYSCGGMYTVPTYYPSYDYGYGYDYNSGYSNNGYYGPR